MIQIQLKNGTKFLTHKVEFVVLGNVEYIDFWVTASDKRSSREEVKVSDIDCISLDTESMAGQLRGEISEVLSGIGSSLHRLKEHLMPTEKEKEVVDESLLQKEGA